MIKSRGAGRPRKLDQEKKKTCPVMLTPEEIAIVEVWRKQWNTGKYLSRSAVIGRIIREYNEMKKEFFNGYSRIA